MNASGLCPLAATPAKPDVAPLPGSLRSAARFARGVGAVAEYVILLAASGGAVLDRVKNAVSDDPMLFWGGIAAVVLIAVWVLKPNR